MVNPYLERAAKSKIGTTGRKSEKRLTKEVGGRARPASGAMVGAKGDIALDDVLMEAKSTISDSMTLPFKWLAKIAKEALHENKSPALAISFVDEQGRPHENGEWVMVPLRVWKEHIE